MFIASSYNASLDKRNCQKNMRFLMFTKFVESFEKNKILPLLIREGYQMGFPHNNSQKAN